LDGSILRQVKVAEVFHGKIPWVAPRLLPSKTASFRGQVGSGWEIHVASRFLHLYNIGKSYPQCPTTGGTSFRMKRKKAELLDCSIV